MAVRKDHLSPGMLPLSPYIPLASDPPHVISTSLLGVRSHPYLSSFLPLFSTFCHLHLFLGLPPSGCISQYPTHHKKIAVQLGDNEHNKNDNDSDDMIIIKHI